MDETCRASPWPVLVMQKEGASQQLLPKGPRSYSSLMAGKHTAMAEEPSFIYPVTGRK